MTIALTDIGRCFEGEIPAMLCTVSADGWPNLTHLSHVFRVDSDHVAASNQFFEKTKRNLTDNPLGMIVVVDPLDLASYRLLVQYEGEETSGPTFETMRRSIDAIAALTGMSDVFALRSAELFRVLDVELVRTRSAVAGG